jgi:LysR family transcriptional activator of nhaA
MLPADPAIDRNGSASRSPSASRLLENLQELNYLHLLYFWTVARDGSIAGACARLQISQPTISMQIRKLEKSLGHRLFDRSGRGLVLTEIGRTVYEYADEMFSLGRELLGTLRGLPGKNSGRLHVGVPTFLPKLITYRLLEPVLRLPQDIQLVCHHDDLNELVSGLVRHRFDAVLSDTPIYSAAAARTFSHPLGECEVVLCGAPALATKYRARFPDSLDGAPLLLPTPVSDMRRSLDRWFDGLPFNPRIVAEFDDSALMKEFGAHGNGLFPIPAIVLDQVRRQYGIEHVGRVPNLRVKYYMVTTERKIKHPATAGIVQTAKAKLPQDGKAVGADGGVSPKRATRLPSTQRLSRAGLKPL